MQNALEIYHSHKDPVSKIKKLTGEQLWEKEQKKKAKPAKYLNTPIVIDDIWFQSTGEGHYYLELKDQINRGLIKGFKRQVRFPLDVNGMKTQTYIADFMVEHFDGTVEVIDHKSDFTKKIKLYQLKKALMMAVYQMAIKEVGK